MPPRCPRTPTLLLPFLYPTSLFATHSNGSHLVLQSLRRRGCPAHQQRFTHSPSTTPDEAPNESSRPLSHLNPSPHDYSAPNFADKAALTLCPGAGGNGCVSFLREAYLPEGPANGGDGGHGGNIYVEATYGETSLHKLSRRRFIRADRGKHGRGSAQAGQRGEDVVISVPVGTVIREVSRNNPVAEDAAMGRALRAQKKRRRRLEIEQAEQEARDAKAGIVTEEEEDAAKKIQHTTSIFSSTTDEYGDAALERWERGKWLFFPGLSKTDRQSTDLPILPRRDRQYAQPPSPIYLDLSEPTPQPILLAAGGIGGLGNPHFVTRDRPRPMLATRGEPPLTMNIELELRLLADVGLVGLPNAGKSTLLRALTRSRTRVGNWPFTTLQPNIGTVVLDNYAGHPAVRGFRRGQTSSDDDSHTQNSHTRFSIADIPGLVEGAHLDRGLGIAFLRHVERARILAFVIDLSAGDAPRALDALWNEVGLYARMRAEDERQREAASQIDWDISSETGTAHPNSILDLGFVEPPKNQDQSSIVSKPWFVVATKADLPDTQANFFALRDHVAKISSGETPHPAGWPESWDGELAVVPVSAREGQGVDRIVHWAVGLLDGR